MRVRVLSLLGASALVAALVASFAPAAGAESGARPTATGSGRVTSLSPSAPNLEILYDQNNSDAGNGISSQNFTDPDGSFDIYDDGGADDFVVPAGETWTVQEVVVTGVYYNGFGPADSEHVRFYMDDGGRPGAILADRPNLAGTDLGGSFDILLGSDVVLTEGTYWVGVRVNMDLGSGGQWGWEIRTAQGGANASMWKNRKNGFGTGCTDWETMETCIFGGPQGTPDFMFAVAGLKG
jgi:hypothetical protein